MATFIQLFPTSSKGKLLVVVTIALLLVAGSVVQAQNTNNANNNANSNTANNNTNNNNNANANTNTNQNNNANGNTNQNTQPTAAPNASAVAEARRDKLPATYWFPAIISLMFAFVVVPFAWTIMRAIRFSKHTFNSPLGLPEGSLRAMLAFMLVSYLGFYVLVSILSLTELKPPDFLLGIVATVIGFYFGSRQGEDKAGGAAAPTGGVEGKVEDNTGAPAIGATVQLSQPSGRKLTATTDVNGQYKIEKVPVGDYNIEATTTGHTSGSQKVSVKAGAPQTVNLKLN